MERMRRGRKNLSCVGNRRLARCQKRNIARSVTPSRMSQTTSSKMDRKSGCAGNVQTTGSSVSIGINHGSRYVRTMRTKVKTMRKRKNDAWRTGTDLPFYEGWRSRARKRGQARAKEEGRTRVKFKRLLFRIQPLEHIMARMRRKRAARYRKAMKRK